MDPGSGQKYTFILTPSAPLGVQRTAETQYVMLDKNINQSTAVYLLALCDDAPLLVSKAPIFCLIDNDIVID